MRAGSSWSYAPTAPSGALLPLRSRMLRDPPNAREWTWLNLELYVHLGEEGRGLLAGECDYRPA